MILQFVQIRLITERTTESLGRNKPREKDEKEEDRKGSQNTVGSQSLQPEPHGDNNYSAETLASIGCVATASFSAFTSATGEVSPAAISDAYFS